MSGTFIVALIVALVLVFYWRVALMIIIAIVLSLLVMGIGAVSGALEGQERPPSVGAPVAPGAPEPAPGGPVTGSVPDGVPRPEPVPPG